MGGEEGGGVVDDTSVSVFFHAGGLSRTSTRNGMVPIELKQTATACRHTTYEGSTAPYTSVRLIDVHSSLRTHHTLAHTSRGGVAFFFGFRVGCGYNHLTTHGSTKLLDLEREI